MVSFGQNEGFAQNYVSIRREKKLSPLAAMENSFKNMLPLDRKTASVGRNIQKI